MEKFLQKLRQILTSIVNRFKKKEPEKPRVRRSFKGIKYEEVIKANSQRVKRKQVYIPKNLRNR